MASPSYHKSCTWDCITRLFFFIRTHACHSMTYKFTHSYLKSVMCPIYNFCKPAAPPIYKGVATGQSGCVTE
ncbi:hypothetical protein K443DRAFT_436873 [Laccaria amethystina LaAM-08-1]|uniref:Uncharacterized protein n=1 Tax=Laccaria amethystina LaAM-08-1 TaxID=1095629 RepID=A0A0C9Y7S1_9AGAR|nr:hypothetical protein K443DRAFT_436873 [Laccaria amethystina LaAM-08-1]